MTYCMRVLLQNVSVKDTVKSPVQEIYTKARLLESPI